MADKYGLPTDYNSQLIQQYLGYQNQAVGQQRNSAIDQVNLNESVMFETLGRQQLQAERDIANRRIQAQRSGMTSAQLAAFEMQNIMAGQLGAQQVAQQSMLERAQITQQYAGAEAANYANAFQMINSNLANVAAIDAQRYSSSAVMQMKELFPNASEDQLQILARQYLGFELNKFEKNKIAGMSTTNSDALFNTDMPMDFKSYANTVLGTTRSGQYDAYEEYVKEYNKRHGTTYSASATRITNNLKNRTGDVERDFLEFLKSPNASKRGTGL